MRALVALTLVLALALAWTTGPGRTDGFIPDLSGYQTRADAQAQVAKASRIVANQIGQIVTNSTVETAFVFDKPFVIPAGTLTPGTVIRVTQMGVYQSGLSQSILPRIRLGPATTALTSRPILAATAGPVSGLLNANADTPWGATTYHIVLPDQSIISAGVLLFSTSLTAALNALVATGTSVSGVDPNVDNVLTASAQWSAASAANQIRATQFFVEIIKP